MKFGVMMFPTDYSMSPMDLAREAEARGYESIWYPEHSHIPSSRKSAWPGGGDLPKMYYDSLDPFVALSAAAAVTKSIKLATGICLVVQRDPIHLAKEISTLDRISNGRVILGVGAGWNAEEMADHGTADFADRFRLMRERIEAMKAIWTENEPEYHGKYVNFDAMRQWPKPVQKPHPPILVGGGFPQAARRAIRYGDGWMPIGGRGVDWIELMPKYRQMAAEAGRNPDEVPMTVFGAPTDLDQVKRMADAGVERAIFGLPAEQAEACLPILDAGAKLADALAA